MDYTPLPFWNAFPIAPPGARTLYSISHPRTYKKFYNPVFGYVYLSFPDYVSLISYTVLVACCCSLFY